MVLQQEAVINKLHYGYSLYELFIAHHPPLPLGFSSISYSQVNESIEAVHWLISVLKPIQDSYNICHKSTETPNMC